MQSSIPCVCDVSSNLCPLYYVSVGSARPLEEPFDNHPQCFHRISLLKRYQTELPGAAPASLDGNHGKEVTMFAAPPMRNENWYLLLLPLAHVGYKPAGIDQASQYSISDPYSEYRYLIRKSIFLPLRKRL
ncbi:uncharacterized protein LOC144226839 [Crocuta crocuta]